MKDILTDKQIESNKAEIISLLKSTGREGVDRVISFLYKSGFFYLYGSFRHHNYRGGLAEHSLGVCRKALAHNEGCNKDSVIIAALLHDICKTKYEFKGEDKEKYLRGHGAKSLAILTDFLKFPLMDEEKRAIRFHMRGKPRQYDEETLKEYNIAKDEPLRELIQLNDWFDAGKFNESSYSLASTLGKMFGK